MRETPRSREWGEQITLAMLRYVGKQALRRYVQPDFVMDDIHTLTSEELGKKASKTKLVILDVDNTLEGHLAEEISTETRSLLENLREGGYKIAIASNCLPERGKQLREIYGEYVDCIATPEESLRKGPVFRGKKPTTGMIDYILETTGFAADEAIIFGDQILKDVLVGKRAGIKTAYVSAYGEKGNKSVEMLQRGPERKILTCLGARALKHGDFLFPRELTPFTTWARAA